MLELVNGTLIRPELLYLARIFGHLRLQCIRLLPGLLQRCLRRELLHQRAFEALFQSFRLVLTLFELGGVLCLHLFLLLH